MSTDSARHAIDSRAALWAAVSALMQKHYGRENLQRLARDVKVSPATCTRLKEQHTSIGIDIVARIAERVDLAAWQLLVPGFDPDNPPVLQPVSPQERRLYDRIMAAAKEIVAEPGAIYDPPRAAPSPHGR